MKKYVLFFFACFFAQTVLLMAQEPFSGFNKIDVQLKYWISTPSSIAKDQPGLFKNGPIANPLIPVIFKCNDHALTLVAKHNGQLHSTIGNIYTAMIPLNEIIAFASEKEITRVESSQKVHLTNDKARQLIGADKVSAGQLPSGIPYTGKGVIVGIFDTGIDFSHPDFRKKGDTTKTRIMFIWDQAITNGTPPQNYNYGTEWNNQQINAALTNLPAIQTKDIGGHGTHVTGIAAGLRGIAYDADIITVCGAVNWDSDSSLIMDTKPMLDGFSYIYQKALAAGKPCVVNLSVGYNLGAPHNGTSLVELGLDNLVNSKSGFLICVAAGNENTNNGHFGGINLSTDSIWTYAPAINQSVLYSVFDATYDDSIFISIIVDSASFDGIHQDSFIVQKKIFQTPWLKLKDIRNSVSGNTFTVKFSNNSNAASLSLTASAFDSNTTELFIKINSLQSTVFINKITLFRISLKGKGLFHSWWENWQVTPWYNPYQWSNYEINARHIYPDNNYMMNILACGKRTISVGAFFNKTKFKNIKNVTTWGDNYLHDSSGTLCYFSSLGPTTDGRIKPDLCAPGGNVASSRSRFSPTDSNYQTDPYTIVFSGTSMASPMATGAIALYLEKFPNATFDEVRSALISSTIIDSLTITFGALPNNHWGYGRLDIYKAMGGLYHAAIDDAVANRENFLIYPNPASHLLHINVPNPVSDEFMSIYDLNGKVLISLPLTNSEQHIDVSLLKSGMYFLIISGENHLYSAKFLVE